MDKRRKKYLDILKIVLASVFWVAVILLVFAMLVYGGLNFFLQGLKH